MTEQIELQKTFKDQFELRQWLAETARKRNLDYLLAFDEDGVIWGQFDENRLKLAAESLPDVAEIKTPLRPQTLRQVRIFGKRGEVLLWATKEGVFNARLLNEDDLDDENIFTETYWLWGTGMIEPGTDGSPDFTLMHEGKQGLRHAPPLPDALGRRGGLIVKHHLEYDEKGQAYIARSRLAGLKSWKEAHQNGA